MSDLLTKGRSSHKAGDYVAAVAYYEEEVRAHPQSDDAVEELFGALRQVSLYQFLVDKFLQEYDLPEHEYRGLDGFRTKLSRESVQRRMDELIRGFSVDSPVGLKMYASRKTDEFVRNGHIQVDPAHPVFGHPIYSAAVRLLLALQESQDGKECHLASLIEANPLCGQAHLLMGRICSSQGRGSLALESASMAVHHPEDSWFDIGRNAGDAMRMTQYRDHDIVFFKGEFHAIPKRGDCYIYETNSRVELLRNSVPSGLRKVLLKILPSGIVSVLRQLVHSTSLRQAVIKPVSLSGSVRAHRIRELCTAMGHLPSGLEGRTASAQ